MILFLYLATCIAAGFLDLLGLKEQQFCLDDVKTEDVIIKSEQLAVTVLPRDVNIIEEEVSLRLCKLEIFFWTQTD